MPDNEALVPSKPTTSQDMMIQARKQRVRAEMEAACQLPKPPAQFAISDDEWGALDPATRLEVLETYLEEAQITLRDIKVEFPRMKMPGGSVAAFELPTGDIAKSFESIIIYHARGRAWWKNPQRTGTGGSIPDCSSVDGLRPVTGKGPTGATKCSQCPYDQFGSAPPKDGQESRGKACREFVALYPWNPGFTVPWLFRIPATSMRIYAQYCTSLVNRKPATPLTSLYTEFGLEQRQGPSGDYFVLKLTAGRLVPWNVMLKAREVRSQWYEEMSSRGVQEAMQDDDLAQSTSRQPGDEDMPHRTDADFQPEGEEVPF